MLSKIGRHNYKISRKRKISQGRRLPFPCALLWLRPPSKRQSSSSSHLITFNSLTIEQTNNSNITNILCTTSIDISRFIDDLCSAFQYTSPQITIIITTIIIRNDASRQIDNNYEGSRSTARARTISYTRLIRNGMFGPRSHHRPTRLQLPFSRGESSSFFFLARRPDNANNK